MQKTNNVDDVEILVLSFDGFSDIWPVFFENFFGSWTQCPYKVNLITNYKEYDDLRVKSLKVGEDKDWSNNLLIALERISSKYVLCLFDDFIITTPIENHIISSKIDFIKYVDGSYLRLRPEPKPGRTVSPEIGLIAPGALYRVSLCTSIVKVEVLKSLLVKGESAWDFEFNGSVRSDIYSKFYSSTYHVINYINGIEKGRWTPKAVEFLKEKAAKLDFSKRGIYHAELKNRNRVVFKLKNFILFSIIPPSLQRNFLFFLQKFK